MTKAEYELYIVKTFDAFCRKVIRNTAIDCHREISRQREREKSFSDLSESEQEALSVIDTYNIYSKKFDVFGETVTIRDPDLGEALQYIQPQLRNIVFMRYFLNMSNTEIASKLNISNSTVSYRLDTALNQLREQIVSMNDTKSA